jgi:transposase
LERRRRLAVRRVTEDHMRAVDVARVLGVHERSVRRWVDAHAAGGGDALAARPHPGPRPRLTAAQADQAVAFTDAPATSFGFDGDWWTAPRLARVIGERLGVRFNVHYLSDWCRRHKVTPQRPRRKPRERNDAAVAEWAASVWPALLGRAAAAAAQVVLIDEAGLMLAPLLRRSLSRRGRTPVVTQRAAHRKKVGVQAGVVLNPDGSAAALHYRAHPDAYVNGEASAAFLRELTWRFGPNLIVVWDRGNMHKGPAVRAALAEMPGVSAEHLPAYAPDLNPVEWLWSWLKYGRLANVAPHDVAEILARGTRLLDEAAASPIRLQGFVNASGLDRRPKRALAA